MPDYDQHGLEPDDVFSVTENVLVAEFPEETPVTDETFAAMERAFVEYASRPAVDTHVTVLGMDEPLNSAMFERAQQAAEKGLEHGVTTWIVVADDIKDMALKTKVDDIPGLEPVTATTKEEALRMADR